MFAHSLRNRTELASTRKFVLFLLLTLLSATAGLVTGSVALGTDELLSAMMMREGVASDIVWQLRAPRVFAAFVTGALLSVAGCFLQTLLRNPLADPYIFGVSSGAATGVLAAMLLGLTMDAGYLMGFGGAASVAMLVALLSYRVADWNPYRLLLTGVMVAAGLNALISLVLVLAPSVAVKGMLFWLMGDLTYAEPPFGAALLLCFLVVLSVVLGSAINALSLGRLKAASLGVATRRLEYILYLGAAAGTAAAVLTAGTIGFVGLVVPHLIRLCGVHDHRQLVPLSALAGGSLVIVADTAARSVWAPV
ncbi:MAG: iron chelate uptake ABC transporter family permease subunit, partial [Burkholderiales bacterium]|nr:iron chelate uptake ABC transporter family permease subunit [Burkholderiales bacterium]